MSFPDLPFQYLGVTPETACQFFAAFSRVEYALKAADLLQDDRLAKASWDRFALRIADQFASGTADPDHTLSAAVRFLLAEPPQVQVQQDGRMQWAAWRRRQHSTDLQHLFDLVKQVRNNLFHGGKYFNSQKERDEALIGCSMTILEACVHMDTDVE